jgi:hypothetical protein
MPGDSTLPPGQGEGTDSPPIFKAPMLLFAGSVIPVEVEILRFQGRRWMPASAGMTNESARPWR